MLNGALCQDSLASGKWALRSLPSSVVFFFFSFCGIRICLRQSAPPHRLLFGTTFSFSFVQHVCGVPEIKEVAIWSIPRAPLKSCHSSGRQAGKGSGGCANGTGQDQSRPPVWGLPRAAAGSLQLFQVETGRGTNPGELCDVLHSLSELSSVLGKNVSVS